MVACVAMYSDASCSSSSSSSLEPGDRGSSRSTGSAPVDEAGEQLFCSHCTTADGRQLFSSRRLEECPARTFDNRDGELVCTG